MARRKAAAAESGAEDDRNNFEAVDRRAQVLFYHHKRRLAVLENEAQVASRALSAGRKRAKEELGETALDDIKEARKWDKKGGEGAVKAAFERLARLTRWAGFSTGVQGELFRDAPEQVTPRERGYLAGLNGDEPSPSYDAASSEGQEWMEGYHDGQAAIFGIQREKEAEENEEDDFREVDDEAGDQNGHAVLGDGDDGAPPPLGGADDEDGTDALH